MPMTLIRGRICRDEIDILVPVQVPDVRASGFRSYYGVRWKACYAVLVRIVYYLFS